MAVKHTVRAEAGMATMAALCDYPGTVRAGEELDLTRLKPFLVDHLGPGEEIIIEQFPGGHSNLTYLIRWANREVVLRRPPFGSKVKSAHDMAREYRVLSKLYGAYPVAPKAILYCDDLSILNTPFYLMEPVRGVIIRRGPLPGVPFPPQTARKLSEVFLITSHVCTRSITRQSACLIWANRVAILNVRSAAGFSDITIRKHTTCPK